MVPGRCGAQSSPWPSPLLVLAQLAGSALAVGAVLVLYPDAREVAADVTRLDTPRSESRS